MPSSSQASDAAPALAQPLADWRPQPVVLDERVTIAAFEAGCVDPDGPTIVFVHGLGHWTQAAWDFVGAELQKSHRLVAFDLPGFGDSSKPDVAYPLDLFVATLRAVVERFALRRFALVGHSLGGLIAADYARRHPNRVRLLALIDPAGFLRTPKLLLCILGSRPFTALFRRIRPSRRFVRRTFETAVYEPASISEAMHARMFELSQNSEMTRAFARVYRDALGTFLDLPGLHARLTAYAGPTLLVWGRGDRYVPIRALDGARRVYPQAEVAILERCGHCPNIEYPRELADLLRAAGA